MAELPRGQERLLKQIISSRRCRICHRTFDRSHVRLAAKHEELWIVSARCTACRHQQIFWVTMRQDRGEEELRDVSDEEQASFEAMAPLSHDDVLDMHLFLADFNGDFKSLFGLPER